MIKRLMNEETFYKSFTDTKRSVSNNSDNAGKEIIVKWVNGEINNSGILI